MHGACRVRSPDVLTLITVSEFGNNYESCGMQFSKTEDSVLLNVIWGILHAVLKYEHLFL